MPKSTKAADSAQVKRLRKSLDREKAKNAALARSLAEAVQQQAAATEILKVISSSPTDVQPVFDAIARSARRLFGARSAYVSRLVDDTLHLVAFTATTKSGDEALKELFPAKLTGEGAAGKAILTGKPAWVADFETDPAYSVSFRRGARERGYRSVLAVPMMREGDAIGGIVVTRRAPGRFTDQQISLLQTFADQAVIAIENVRLFNETKEALERQTATAEILGVISSSPTDVQPVFDAIVTSARQLIGGFSASVTRVIGDLLHLAAFTATDKSGVEALKRFYPVPISQGNIGRAIRTRTPIYASDTEIDREISSESRELARARGYRSLLNVPMIREGVVIGLINVTRREPGSFTDHQINLIKTFADQAVIAIENVRLFNETREALERQTATAEILKVIAGSPTDVQPVFEVIVQSAVRLCGARFGRVYRYDGSIIEMVAGHGLSAKGIQQVRQVFPRAASDDTIVGRVILTRQPFFLKDIQSDESVPELSRQMIEALDTRSQVTVPMLRAGESIGAITMGWDAPGAFDEQKVALLQTFADQAVIAIENVRLFNETKEALERQTATAEVLRVISSSPTNLKPVFDAILSSALRLCNAQLGILNLREGDLFRGVAQSGGSPEFEAWFAERGPIKPEHVLGRLLAERQPVHIADMRDVSAYKEGKPTTAKIVELGGARTFLAVPLLKDGEVVGNIGIYRSEVRPFAERQIGLVRTFADQAVIAIENVRLFNETREALERQTATADVLRAISTSPTDTQPVFEAILERATKLCSAESGILFRYVDGAYHALATRIPNPEFAALFREPRRPPPGSKSGLARITRLKRVVHIPDMLVDEATLERDPLRMETVRGGMRSWLGVPLLKDGELTGAIVIYRSEPLPFSAAQIGLLETFAEQAVIAIENVRLFNAEQQRTAELRESLEYQTAFSSVLNVISRSPSDIQPVLDTITETAQRLCQSKDCYIFRLAGDRYQLAAVRDATEEQIRFLRERPIAQDRSSITGRVALEGRAVHVPDVLEDADYQLDARGHRGYRTILGVPLLRDGGVIGVIVLTHEVVRPFTEKQVELVSTFADQAVIAIENVRLFNETSEALERQTATAEILKVIASSPSDVQPVFDQILHSCQRLFEGLQIGLTLAGEDGMIHLGAYQGENREHLEQVYPYPLGRDSGSGQAMLDRKVVQFADIGAPGSDAPPRVLQGAQAAGVKSLIFAPLIAEGRAIGALWVGRRLPGPFGDDQAALLKTFADQAVIAIENVRLFNETKEALERQTSTAEILKVISSSPTDVQPVFDAIVRSAARLFDPWVATITILEDGHLHWKATAAAREEDLVMEQTRSIYPLPFDPSRSPSARAILERTIVEIPDTTAPDIPEFTRRARQVSGFGAITFVPLTREGKGIGTIILASPQVGSKLTDKQLDLVKTFAAQAVIAIENVRLFNETKEALERQTATAEILKVIASSPSDVQPVFDAIVNSVARLFGRKAALRTVEPEGLRRRARSYDPTPGEFHGPDVEPLDRNSIVGLAILEGRAMQWKDTLVDGAAHYGMEKARSLAFRSIASAPLLRDGKAIGVISVSSPEPGALSEKQMELLSTFADQAVIAIENVRLFNETKESLERQTATAEILKVMASSPSDVQPVFDAIAASARRLLGGHAANVARRAGDVLELAAFTSTGEAGDSELGRLWPSKITGKGHMGKALLSAAPAWVEDIETDLGYSEEFRAGARARGMRSAVSVPMLREGEAIGVISVNRSVPGRFSDHQTNLLKTFADQAVIAIENVRLFNETREALERQTATAEILKVIASSPSDVQPVFDAIAASALRLFGGYSVTVSLVQGDQIVRGAAEGWDEAAKLVQGRFPRPLDRETITGRIILDCKVQHVPDTQAPDQPQRARELNMAVGAHALLGAPMVREGRAIGAIMVARKVSGAFSDKQIELLKTFADQAVIAIENVRLFKELQQRTEALTKSVGQLTALGEVGQAISSTLDLETVLKTIATRAVQLTGLDGASIYEYDEQREEFRLQAADNLDEAVLQAVRRAPIRKGDGTVGATAITLEATQVPDIMDPRYQSSRKELLIKAGYRAVLTVPLLRDDHIIGALSVSRKTPGAFAPEIVELLKTFATQSAMAIQNARLFREIAEKGKQLEEASKHKSQFLASMSHELRTPLNAILGFNEMILGDVYGEVPADMKEPLADIQTSGKHLLRLINNVLDLAKIEAGRMELALADYSVQDTVESVRSTLRPLAAEKGLEFVADVPGDVPLAYGDGGRMTQCLMNLAGNSLKFTRQGRVEIGVEVNDGLLRYRVSDTGIGIPPDKIASLFTEFKQTDATIASEFGGTGLGLSITKKFVEMHRGRIWVESEPGKGSAFFIEIPLRLGEGASA